MRFITSSLATFFFTVSALTAQTLYVPGGTVTSISGSNVGIGTSSPEATLSLGAAGGKRLLIYDGGSSGPQTGFGVDMSGSGRELSIFHTTSGTDGDIAFGKRLEGTGTFTDAMRITGTGNVGIGAASPVARLEVRGGSAQNTYTVDTNAAVDILALNAQYRPYDGAIISFGDAFGATGYIKAAGLDGAAGAVVIGNRRGASDTTMQPGIVLDVSGNVGIGTTSPSAKLAVNGSIRAREVVVTSTGWSDYVFADDYRLAPLSEVEAHIKQDKHLPGIPSAAEVDAGGISLGDMQSKLLAKVEELTLHLIAQEKRFAAVERENAELRQQVNELKAR